MLFKSRIPSRNLYILTFILFLFFLFEQADFLSIFQNFVLKATSCFCELDPYLFMQTGGFFTIFYFICVMQFWRISFSLDFACRISIALSLKFLSILNIFFKKFLKDFLRLIQKISKLEKSPEKPLIKRL